MSHTHSTVPNNGREAVEKCSRLTFSYADDGGAGTSEKLQIGIIIEESIRVAKRGKEESGKGRNERGAYRLLYKAPLLAVGAAV